MKASIRLKYGQPDQINVKNTDKPDPKDNEVLIKNFTTTVNRTDCANLTAKPFIMRFMLGLTKPRKTILGTDFAGIVDGIGKDVKLFSVGDKVFGFNDLGAESQAEYVVIPEKGNILPFPTNIDCKQAAASLEGAHYAYSFIHKVSIQKGQNILVNGATGGIGSALLQMLKQFDVQLTATCNTKNVELIKSLGADKIIDYTKEDFTKSSEKYDFVFDTVGKSTFGKCKPILKKKGIYISSELGPFAQNLFFALFTPLFGNKKVIFPKPYSIKKTLPYIYELLEKEVFKPVIDREYSLDDIAIAYEFVLSGAKTGNVIVNIQD